MIIKILQTLLAIDVIMFGTALFMHNVIDNQKIKKFFGAVAFGTIIIFPVIVMSFIIDNIWN